MRIITSWWVANRLGVSIDEAERSLRKLADLGFLKLVKRVEGVSVWGLTRAGHKEFIRLTKGTM